jgi:hypothetical protein
MSDKMLMENWRKFLVETPLYMDPGLGEEPAHGESFPDPEARYAAGDKARLKARGRAQAFTDAEEGEEAERKEMELLESTAMPTIKDFLDFVRGLGEGGIMGDVPRKKMGRSVASIAVGLKGPFTEIFSIFAEQANSKEMSRTEYTKNPYLYFLDFWPTYEAVIENEVIESFLTQLSTDPNVAELAEDSDMPDIDQLLEKYLLRVHKIKIDGAPHAIDEWDARAKKMILRKSREAEAARRRPLPQSAKHTSARNLGLTEKKK